MKIENGSNSFIPASTTESASRNSFAKQADTLAPTPGVSVNIGSTNQLRGMDSSVTNAPMVDAKKVAEIKQAISEGRFQINSAAIADSLINDVNELISAEDR